ELRGLIKLYRAFRREYGADIARAAVRSIAALTESEIANALLYHGRMSETQSYVDGLLMRGSEANPVLRRFRGTWWQSADDSIESPVLHVLSMLTQTDDAILDADGAGGAAHERFLADLGLSTRERTESLESLDPRTHPPLGVALAMEALA